MDCEALVRYLASLQAGPIPEPGDLESFLAPCWDEFAGSESEGMTGVKLGGRMERVTWDPPILCFIVERHGGTVMGSSRAELQQWTLNIDHKTAHCQVVSHRQLRSMEPRLNLRPIAEEVAQLIIARQEHEWLKWYEDGRVRIHIGKILPAGSAYKRTLEGRRKRFRAAMDELLGEAGWQKIRANVYNPPADVQGQAAE